MADEIPTGVLVGKADHEWPLRLFPNDSGGQAQATAWANGAGPGDHRRRLWRGTLTLEAELVVKNPAPVLVQADPVEGAAGDEAPSEPAADGWRCSRIDPHPGHDYGDGSRRCDGVPTRP